MSTFPRRAYIPLHALCIGRLESTHSIITIMATNYTASGTATANHCYWYCQPLPLVLPTTALLLPTTATATANHCHWYCQPLPLVLPTTATATANHCHWYCQPLPLVLPTTATGQPLPLVLLEQSLPLVLLEQSLMPALHVH